MGEKSLNEKINEDAVRGYDQVVRIVQVKAMKKPWQSELILHRKKRENRLIV